MQQAEENYQPLTDYERAICYYTLPRLVTPTTQGAILLFGLCLAASVAVMLAAISFDQPRWLYIGAGAYGALVCYAILHFSGRAFLNAVRKRRILAEAEGVPDARTGADDIPDPFAGHVLLRHPIYYEGLLFACTERDASIAYFVDVAPNRAWWKIKSPQDTEICRVKVLSRSTSFQFNPTITYPARIGVFKDDKQIALIQRRFSLRDPGVEILLQDAPERKYLVRQGAIHAGQELVGRIYFLRNTYYLDIREEAFNEAILAYFVTIT